MSKSKPILKVLILTHNLSGRGGSFMRSYSLARKLASMGHSMTLMASRADTGLKARVEVEDSLQIAEMPDIFPSRLRNGGLSPIDIFARALFAGRHRYDIVHAFDHRPAVSLPSLLAKAMGTLMISDWADLWGRGGIADERSGLGILLGQMDQYWERRFRDWAEGATVITSDLGRRLQASGLPVEKQLLLPPGSNTDLIRPLDSLEARQRYGLPGGARIIAFTGFAPYDAEILVEVVWRVLLAEPRAIAVASGRAPDNLLAALRERKIEGRLWDLGIVPFRDLEQVLACADILLLPYANKEVNRGRFPNRFGDYLAAGKAIVTNPTGDLGEMVEANRIAVLAPEDPADYAQVVIDLLKDPQRRAVLGMRARKFAEDELSWDILARKVEGFYIELLSSLSRE